jgi:hypothetical protein
MRTFLYLLTLLSMTGCFPEGTKVEYQPGSSNRTFSSREEALSIVRASWEATNSANGFSTKTATNDGLTDLHDHSKGANVSGSPLEGILGGALRGKKVYTCPYDSIKECEIRQGFGPGRKCVVFVHASVPSPWGGDDIFGRADFTNEADAITFADALLYLAKPDLFPKDNSFEAPSTPNKQGSTSPQEPAPKLDHLGVVESVNKRWEFVLITPASSQHGLKPNSKLVIKRSGRVVASLIITKTTPSSITTKVSPAGALDLVQVGDKVYDE